METLHGYGITGSLYIITNIHVHSTVRRNEKRLATCKAECEKGTFNNLKISLCNSMLTSSYYLYVS